MPTFLLAAVLISTWDGDKCGLGNEIMRGLQKVFAVSATVVVMSDMIIPARSAELHSEAKPFEECVVAQNATGEMLGIVPKVTREGEGYRAVRLPSRRKPGQWVEMICDREAGALSIRDMGGASAGTDQCGKGQTGTCDEEEPTAAAKPATPEIQTRSTPKFAPSLVEKKPFAECVSTQDSTGEMLGLKPQIMEEDPDRRAIRFPSRRAAGRWTEMICDRQTGTLSIREVVE